MFKLNVLIKVSRYLKDNYPEVSIRIDTNGQANLIHNQNVVSDLAGLIDSISISLNASTAEKYQKICQSDYGLEAFPAVIKFIREAKKYIPEVTVSVVDYDDVDVESCKQLAEELDVKFKVRRFKI